MKYFTYDLWDKMNSECEKERLNADEQWIKNAQEYEKIYKNIKNKLTNKFITIYEKNECFHDFKLKDIKIIHGEYGTKNPVEININITNKFNSWVIKYKNIKTFAISYHYDNTSFAENRGFDDFGYDEFSIITDKVLCHEILFASGSTILINFEKISITKIK